MSLYGIIADLRREHPTPGVSRTLDLVVAELGSNRDNLRRALAAVEARPIPTAGRPVLRELEERAAAEGLDDIERPLAPDEELPLEPIDESQVGIAVLLGGSAVVATALALGVVVLALNQILHFF